MKYSNLLAVTILAAMGASCTPSSDSSKTKSTRGTLFIEEISEATAETYVSGREFCNKFAVLTSKEHSRRVLVPMDYNNAGAGDIEIYTWTINPFNPSLPSVLLVDGGPGQNTHGSPSFLEGVFNEIKFDQRGLGCSSPQTFAQYKNPKLYSTRNNVLDMEQIRKAYNLQSWSIYGLSYGTVPATVYASKYPQHTNAVVLEGVFYSYEYMHDENWKAAKYNLILDKMTYSQINGLKKLGNNPIYSKKIAAFFEYAYEGNSGFRLVLKGLTNAITDENNIDYDYIDRIFAALKQESYKGSQRPMATDRNIHSIIACKELGMLRSRGETIFNDYNSRFSGTKYSERDLHKHCATYGVTPADEDNYVASNYPVKVPTVYLQGSHDGATMATGAIKHFQTVPRGQVHMLFNEKGGHNPFLSELSADNPQLVQLSKRLFAKTLIGERIYPQDLQAVNHLIAEEGRRWILLNQPGQNLREVEEAMGGISKRYNQAIGF